MAFLKNRFPWRTGDGRFPEWTDIWAVFALKEFHRSEDGTRKHDASVQKNAALFSR